MQTEISDLKPKINSGITIHKHFLKSPDEEANERLDESWVYKEDIKVRMREMAVDLPACANSFRVLLHAYTLKLLSRPICKELSCPKCGQALDSLGSCTGKRAITMLRYLCKI